MGLSFVFLKKYELSLIYFQKMLRTAWLIKDHDKEIKSYDYIGVSYFYLG